MRLTLKHVIAAIMGVALCNTRRRRARWRMLTLRLRERDGRLAKSAFVIRFAHLDLKLKTTNTIYGTCVKNLTQPIIRSS